jgi:hypothetical protein
VNTGTQHWSLSSVTCIQCTPSHLLALRYIPILSSHLCLVLPTGLYPSGFLTKILYTSPVHATCPTHHILLDLVTLIILGEVYKLKSSLLCTLLQPPATSFLFGPNILFSSLFSHTLNLCSALSLRDEVSHTYKRTGKIIVLCILIFKFLEKRWKKEDY